MSIRMIKKGGKVGLVLFLTTFIPFFLLTYLSSDPAEVVLRVQAITPTPQNIEQTRQELGLNQPFFYRYIDWLWAALQGNLGVSYITGKSIKTMIVMAFPYTLILTVLTVLFVVSLCFGIGLLTVNYQNHWLEKTVRVLTFLLSAVPSFWLGILLISFFSVKLNWFPTGGYSGIRSAILPALTLSLVYSSSYIRLIRSDLIQNKQMSYIAYYQTRGFSNKKITRHLLKNSLRSSLVSMGVSIPKLIAGSIVIESIFSWPGFGLLCITAIHNRDLPVLQAYIVVMSLFFILSSLLIDSVNKRIDARLKERGAE